MARAAVKPHRTEQTPIATDRTQIKPETACKEEQRWVSKQLADVQKLFAN